MATNSLGLTVDVSSSTKDSISVRWRLGGPGGPPGSSVQRDSVVQGFEVRYQAIGSTVVQQSLRLDASASAYDIVQLHENTYYDICVKVFTSLNASGSPSIPSPAAAAASGQASSSSASTAAHGEACTKGTTATDSLWVALGSTFGAFLALGFIVFLVFLAKWQHSRNERKQQLMASAYDDARVKQLPDDDDDDDDDDDYDPKGSSSGVHLPDDLAMSELSGHSSDLSIALYADDQTTANDAGDSDEAQSNTNDDHHHHHHVHGWIAATPYAAEEDGEEEEEGRHLSIDDDDSGIQKELLRPPPIPGIILRPIQPPTGRPGSDQIRPNSSTADHRLGSTERSSGGDAADSSRRHGDEDGGNAASAAASAAAAGQGVIACRPPLKPTASNLW